MNYLIFADESGKWNAGDFYLRSWIKITPENYENLRKEIIFIKHETGIKELKWKSFKNNLEKIDNSIRCIFLINFDVFITISIPNHFQDRLIKDKYNILRTLKEIKTEQSTGGEKFTEDIKNKIIGSAQHTLFFNYFEKQHIENSKKALVNNINNSEYKYIVDTPQCLDKDWEKIAKECGIENIDVEKKSEKIPGIELSDIIAGCIHEYLENDEKAKHFYQTYIKNKMLDMTSRSLPNPNLIFFGDFNYDDKAKINIFR